MSAKRKRFDVGAMMNARKESRLLHEKIVLVNKSIAKKKVCLHNLQIKEKRLDCKMEKTLRDIEQLKEIGNDVAEPARKKGKYLSSRSLENRKKRPTMFEDSKLQLSEKVARSRREETHQAATL